MKVRFFDIEWDTDGEQVDLPIEAIAPCLPDETDLEQEAADILSDKFGWCVKKCDFEILK